MTDKGKDVTLYDVLKAVEAGNAETKNVSNRLDSFQKEMNEFRKEMNEFKDETKEDLGIIKSQMDWLTKQTMANTNDIRNLKQANGEG